MEKSTKKIIHFIYNLSRGGAETMLVTVIKQLPEYEHIIFTLFAENNFADELKNHKIISFNLSATWQIPFAVFKYNKLVKKINPCIIHSHLFWPTFLARAGTPKKYPLVTTIHAFIATSVEYKNWYVKWLDKISYQFKKSTIIGVAAGATKEYFSFLNLKPYTAHTLYTFVDINKFNTINIAPTNRSSTFRVIAVGALRLQKNYLFAVKAFEKLKNLNIELDIYGTGDMYDALKKEIEKLEVKVNLKGQVKNIQEVLPQYNLFLMTSTFEGFSLSVLEAMACGVPLLLSNIESFREQCNDTATYFSLTDTNDLTQKLVAFNKKSVEELLQISNKAKQRAVDNFTLPKHIEGLKKIYNQAIMID